MHLTAFRSDKGDCLLLTNQKDTARILVDGGMPHAFTLHVAPALGELRKKGKNLDLVYVSHIDEDHIGGVLKLLDAEVAWRVHEHQQKSGNASHKPPTIARPPQVGAIWHNAFHEQIKQNAGAIEDALAAAAPVLSGAELKSVREEGLKQASLVTSINQAIQVSRRVGPKQLGIPLNSISSGKLIMVRKNQKAVSIGGMRITIIGPMSKYLGELRKKWNDWLDKNQKALETIRAKARGDESRLTTTDFERLKLTMRLQAEAFGKPDTITPENLASLMLLVEEDGHSMLLTGDARWDELVDGLEATGKVQPGQIFTVDVLKVPHHGSKNNVVDTKFLGRVAAKDYVFCGNGKHGNPHPEVVDLMIEHRLKQPGKFKFWFNSSEAVEDDSDLAEHMADIEKRVAQAAKKANGRLSFKFLKSGTSVEVV